MTKAREAFLADIGKQATRLRQEQKSNEIIKFIRKNWKLFCADRGLMENSIREMGIEGTYSVDSLCDLVGVPDNVFFKKFKVVDNSVALLRFPKSKLFDAFQKCCQMVPSAECLMFAVAGDNTLIVTNMQTSYVEGKMHLFFKSLGVLPDIHIFSPADAKERIPQIFDHQEH